MLSIKQLSFKKISLIVGLGSVTALGILYYCQYLAAHPSTDDAYVNADRATISAQVNGRISKIFVSENQRVHKGDPLFDIDPEAYALQQEKLAAQLRLAEQQIGAADDVVAIQMSKVAQAQAILLNEEKNTNRIVELGTNGRVSHSEIDNALTKVAIARTSLASAQSALRQSQQQLGTLGAGNASLRLAKANLALASLDLDHTHVLAPADGIVTQLKLRQGDLVQNGAPLFALIETDHWWLEANFKETQLTHIKPGQRVHINLDMYPHANFKGTVASISPGSGSSFSILPSENASGNWVKITQRFTVKIDLDQTKHQYPLRIGASAKASVNTAMRKQG